MSHLNVIARDLNLPQNQKMNERQVENNAGSLDVVGFDANVPVLISDFSRGATAPENPIKRN